MIKRNINVQPFSGTVVQISVIEVIVGGGDTRYNFVCKNLLKTKHTHLIVSTLIGKNLMVLIVFRGTSYTNPLAIQV